MGTPPIILTTDFGLADPYAGVMKGVILKINPSATVIDLTHHIQPQNVQQAAFLLGTNHSFFPAGSIHVAVVDPGVGTSRRAVLLVTPTARFLSPDNGLLSHVLAGYIADPQEQPGRVPLPPGCAAYHLTNDKYWLHPLSHTFHGRDVFAPVSAHLSLGIPPGDFGPPVQDLVWLPFPQPTRHAGTLEGEVVYVDHFGNLITNIQVQQLGSGGGVSVEIKGRQIHGLSLTFNSPDRPDGECLRALAGSLGYLEIAFPNGSAAQALDAGPGEAVRVTLPSLG